MPENGSPKRSDPAPGRLQREESQLWRWALGLIVLLAAAVAYFSWEQLKDLPYRLWAIPAGLFVLSILFATYAFGRKREVSDLQQILRGFQERSGAAPTEEQLDLLGQLISRSQRNFKELIDSLDDAALAISLDGTLRTVNRRVTEILTTPYSQLIGHKLEDFLAAPLAPEAPFERGGPIKMRQSSGLRLTFESQRRFPADSMHASLAHANRNFHHSQACGSPPSEGARARSQSSCLRSTRRWSPF